MGDLPKEILDEIVSYIRTESKDLVNYTSVCRNLSAIAAATLYKHVDFNSYGEIFESDPYEEDEDDISQGGTDDGYKELMKRR